MLTFLCAHFSSAEIIMFPSAFWHFAVMKQRTNISVGVHSSAAREYGFNQLFCLRSDQHGLQCVFNKADHRQATPVSLLFNLG